jgi:hypothetical protein
VIAAARRLSERLSSGAGPRSETGAKKMSLAAAQEFAWSLANTLMTPMMLIETSAGYSVVPSDEFDGDPDEVVREYDPWAE